MTQPLSLPKLNDESFAVDRAIDAPRLQRYHEANLHDAQEITLRLNEVTPIDLGEKDGVDGFDVDDVVARYSDGQQFRFTHKGERYKAEIHNGELLCVVMTRVQDLS